MSASKVITGVSVAEAMEPRLTVDGLRNLLLDRRTAKQPLPIAILVSEYDRRDLNQDLMAGARELHGDDVQHPDHDGKAIGVVEGVVIRSHPDVPRGKARLLFPDPKLTPKPEQKLGGEGLIIVGA